MQWWDQAPYTAWKTHFRVAAWITLHLAPATLCLYLISQLGPSWQKFQCTFLFVCWWCCFPNGSSTAGGFILLLLLPNGFKPSLLLKPACPSAPVQEMLMGPCMAHLRGLCPWSQQCTGDGRKPVSQVLLPDTSGEMHETSQGGWSCAECQQGCVLFVFIHASAVLTA